jgi:ammonia channel protein AmtB
MSSIWPQLQDIGSTILLSVIGTIILAKVTGLICGGLRTSSEEEESGLDVTDHGEVGYGGDTGGIPALSGVG